MKKIIVVFLVGFTVTSVYAQVGTFARVPKYVSSTSARMPKYVTTATGPLSGIRPYYGLGNLGKVRLNYNVPAHTLRSLPTTPSLQYQLPKNVSVSNFGLVKSLAVNPQSLQHAMQRQEAELRLAQNHRIIDALEPLAENEWNPITREQFCTLYSACANDRANYDAYRYAMMHVEGEARHIERIFSIYLWQTVDDDVNALGPGIQKALKRRVNKLELELKQLASPEIMRFQPPQLIQAQRYVRSMQQVLSFVEQDHKSPTAAPLVHPLRAPHAENTAFFYLQARRAIDGNPSTDMNRFQQMRNEMRDFRSLLPVLENTRIAVVDTEGKLSAFFQQIPTEKEAAQWEIDVFTSLEDFVHQPRAVHYDVIVADFYPASSSEKTSNLALAAHLRQEGFEGLLLAASNKNPLRWSRQKGVAAASDGQTQRARVFAREMMQNGVDGFFYLGDLSQPMADVAPWDLSNYTSADVVESLRWLWAERSGFFPAGVKITTEPIGKIPARYFQSDR